MADCTVEAWNNLVLKVDPMGLPANEHFRAAAMSALFMSHSNSDGLRDLLECYHDFAASEFSKSLKTIGAMEAAKQLDLLLTGLGAPLCATTKEERKELLDRFWVEALDDHDTLSAEADEELMEALSAHVAQNESFYLNLE